MAEFGKWVKQFPYSCLLLPHPSLLQPISCLLKSLNATIIKIGYIAYFLKNIKYFWLCFFFSDKDNIGDVQVVEWHVCKIIKSLTDQGFTSFCGYIILKAHFVLLNIYEIIFS